MPPDIEAVAEQVFIMADHRFTPFAADPVRWNPPAPSPASGDGGHNTPAAAPPSPAPGFTHCHRNVRRRLARVTQAVPGRKVSWFVADNYFNFTGDETVSA